LIRVQQEAREQGPLPRSTRKERAAALGRLQWAENPKFHRYESEEGTTDGTTDDARDTGGFAPRPFTRLLPAAEIGAQSSTRGQSTHPAAGTIRVLKTRMQRSDAAPVAARRLEENAYVLPRPRAAIASALVLDGGPSALCGRPAGATASAGVAPDSAKGGSR
jgi:hypothetical protein